MCAQNSLLSSLKIYPVRLLSVVVNFCYVEVLLLHLPIHSSCKSFIVVRSEANIEYWRSMLILLDQLSTLLFGTMCIIQVDVSIPRGYQESRRRIWSEFQGGYGVGGGVQKLELDC